MILVDWQLLDRIRRGSIKIDPFDPSLVQPNSVDIRLGNHFVWYNAGSDVIDPFNKESVTADVDETHADYFVLHPGQFVLAETFECIELPDNIVATIEGKSSIARLGVTLHQTGGCFQQQPLGLVLAAPHPYRAGVVFQRAAQPVNAEFVNHPIYSVRVGVVERTQRHGVVAGAQRSVYKQWAWV